MHPLLRAQHAFVGHARQRHPAAHVLALALIRHALHGIRRRVEMGGVKGRPIPRPRMARVGSRSCTERSVVAPIRSITQPATWEDRDVPRRIQV